MELVELLLGVVKIIMVFVGSLLAIGVAGIVGLSMLLIFGWIIMLFGEE